MKQSKLHLPGMILCLHLLVNIVSAQPSSLTFTEIMFTPSESSGEFVEICNTSATETIDLSGYKFKYHTSSNNNLIPLSGGTELFPGKFAVIIQGSYDYEDGIYKSIIPDGTVVLKTSGNNFGSSGMANTTDRTVSLIDPLGREVDIYMYSANNSPGYSDEKIDLTKDNSSTNWGNSIQKNGTPGLKNSISPTDHDLIIYFKDQTNYIPDKNDSIKISAVVKNIGRKTAASLFINIYNDSNADSITHDDEKIFYRSYADLAANDSILIDKNIHASDPGIYFIIGAVSYTVDEDSSNNVAYLSITVDEKPLAPGELIINEFMYEPSSDEPEWIEVYNKSDRKINIKNMKVGDSSLLVAITNDDVYLEPDEFLLISDDTSIGDYYSIPSRVIAKNIPSLNNNGDEIKLLNENNTVIDSLKYISTWGGKNGKSLERISSDGLSSDSLNWKTSSGKFNATPGRINSISQKQHDLSLNNINTDVTYVEYGNSCQIKIDIENKGKSDAALFSFKLCKDRNNNQVYESEEKVSEINNLNLGSGNHLTLKLNVSDFTVGKNTLTGFIDFENDQFNDNDTIALAINCVRIDVNRNDLVVNEIMFAPLALEPEWIEIYNRSSKQIDLNGFQIGDNSSNNKIFYSSKYILPNEFLVISKDSMIFTIYNNLQNTIVSNIPSLNNNGDLVVLYDSLGRVIDSLFYKSTWGGTGGKSLERYDMSAPSNDSSNWRNSFYDRGGSPSKINSISKKNIDAVVTNIVFEPARPAAGNNVKIKTEIVNAGYNNISFKVILNELKNDGSKTQIEQSTELFLKTGLSAQYVFNYVIKSIDSGHNYETEILLQNDEDLTNNKLSASIYPEYTAGSILLNEIMYNPGNGEPEWAELYNNTDRNIDLGDWSISDVYSTPIKTKLCQYSFPPKSLLVVTKDSSIFYFHKIIPSNLLVNNFANMNNDKDGIVIKDYWDNTIDSVLYNNSKGNGKSLERKSFLLGSNDDNNWAYSNDVELSTPGRVNSIAQKDYDLAVLSLNHNPALPRIGDEVSVTAGIKNIGVNPALNFEVAFYLVDNIDTTLYNSVNVDMLNSGDSITVCAADKISLTKSSNVLCRVIFNEDMELSNNTLTAALSPGNKRNDILISEIMYNPAAGESEWIEVYNNANSHVNLKNWNISDLVSPVNVKISKQDLFLPPGEYAVFARDSSGFMFYPPEIFIELKYGSLGNSSDGIIVYDNNNFVIDSVEYNSKWGGQRGVSLERISYDGQSCDSLNWISSININGATPGIKNSTCDFKSYKNGSLVINEIMYEPDLNNSEFLEFYNTTKDSIQIGGMKLLAGSSELSLCQHYYMLPAGNYFVLSADSNIVNNYSTFSGGNNFLLINKSLALPNDGSVIILRDIKGNILDSVFYSPALRNKNISETKNRSIERLNPLLGSNDFNNWSSSVCAEGATPGEQNSVFIQNVSSETKVSICPNPFSPDNDGYEDFTSINFNLSKPLAQIRIKVFDSIGRLVRTLEQNMPAASKGTVIFNGLDDNGNALRIGIYILLIEISSGDGTIEKIKTPVVIARKL